MALFRRNPRTRRTVAARLQKLQQTDVATTDAAAPARKSVRIAFYFAVLVLLLGVGWALKQRLTAPPRSSAACRLSDGTVVRLLSVTRAAPHQFEYVPPRDPLRELFRRCGIKFGWPSASHGMAGIPDDSITLWLQVTAPLSVVPERVEFRSGDGAVYDDVGSGTIRSGTDRWGRGSLVWVSLGNYDHTAKELTAVVPFAPLGDAAEFTIDGPAQPAAKWEMVGSYPFTAGNKDAVVRLQQLRPAQPDLMGLALDGQPIPEPAEAMLVADLDVDEPLGGDERGFWRFELEEAVTRQGERLRPVRDNAGLFWLTRGRTVTGIDALRLKVAAEKRIRGIGNVVFRSLALPKTDEKAVWNATVDGPFPGSEFVAQVCERPANDRIVVTLDGRAPAGTELASFAYAEGLDQEGRRLRNLPGSTLPPDEVRTSEAGNTWRWTFEGRIFPDSQQLALAFRLNYLRVAKRATATFTAPVQPLLTPSEQTACGLVMEPFTKPGEPQPRVRVAAITPDTGAAESSLQPGDELLQVDGLPPSLWGRAMFRHRPSETVDVLFARGGQRFHAQVKLDRAAAKPTP